MYDIRNLNIWKDSGIRDIFRCREKVLKAEVSTWEESVMNIKCEMMFHEMMQLVPEFNITQIRIRNGGKFYFPVYLSEQLMETDLEMLLLSPRSINCLHRAGYHTIGSLVEGITGWEDLKNIRNCGAKSVKEIMEQLFCYQYSQLEQGKKIKFIKRVVELNK